jgi:hypothetical protein
MAKIGRKGGRSLGFNLEYARRLARLELLEKAEQVLFDAVNDETAPIRDRIRAAFYLLDTVPPPDLWSRSTGAAVTPGRGRRQVRTARLWAFTKLEHAAIVAR